MYTRLNQEICTAVVKIPIVKKNMAFFVLGILKRITNVKIPVKSQPPGPNFVGPPDVRAVHTTISLLLFGK